MRQINDGKNKPGGLSNGARTAISFAISVAVALACLFLIYPSLENNDDNIIHLATAGAYGETGDFVFHENTLITRAFVFIQKLIPTINAVTALEYFSVFLAFSFLSALIWLSRPDRIGFSLSLILSLVIAPYVYDKIHYTKYAIIIGAAGVLLIFLSSLEKKRGAFLAVGYLLSAFSFAMRTIGFLCGAAIAGTVCLLCLLFESGLSFFKRNTKTVFAFLVLAVMIGGLFVSSEAIWRTDKTADAAREYNDARWTLSDYYLPEYSANREAYEALGISENDVAIIGDWAYGDTSIYTTELMTSIQSIPNPRGASDWFSRFGETFTGIDLLSVSFYASILLAALSFIISDKKGRFICLIGVAFYFILVFALCVVGRTTRWVETGMLSALAMALIVPLALRKRSLSKNTERAFFVVVIAASIVFAVVYNIPKVTDEDKGKNATVASVYGELTAKEENLYLCDLASLPAVERGFDTFERVPEGFLKNVYFLGGWDTNSPAKNSVLSRYEVASPYSALIEKDNVFLVDTREFDSKAKAVKEHVSEDVCYSLYETLGGCYVFAFADVPSSVISEESIEITGADSELLDINNSFLRIYLNAKTDIKFVSAYVMLKDMDDGSSLTYRAYVIYNENAECGFSITPPYLDIVSGEYNMFLLLKDENGDIYGSAEPFFFSAR